MTGKSLKENPKNPKPNLRKNETKALILRGSCDYKTEAVSLEYENTFINSQFHTIDQAGHMIYSDKPDEWIELIREFLLIKD